MMNSAVKREYLYLCLIYLIAVVLRVIQSSDMMVGMDVVAFSRLGKNFIEGGSYIFGENYNMGVFFPPGYPVFIGITNLLFDDLLFSSQVVSFVASLFTILLGYLLGREMFGGRAGLFTAFAFAIYPVILIFSVDGYSESLFFCFMLLSIYIYFKAINKGSIILHILFGVTAGLTFLTRSEGMFLLLLPFLQIISFFKKERVGISFRAAASFILVIIVFLVTISPYMLFLKDYTGKFTLSGKSNVAVLLAKLADGDMEYHDVVNVSGSLYDKAAFKLNDTKDQLAGWDRTKNLSMAEYILSDPVRLIAKYQRNVLQQVKLLFKLLIPLMLPLVLAFIRKDLISNRKLFVFLLYSMFFFMLYPFFLIIERQTFSIVFFLIVFLSSGFAGSGEAFDHLIDFYGIKRSAVTAFIRRSLSVVIIMIFIITSASYLKFSKFDSADRLYEHARAGRYLKENISGEYESLNVMSRKNVVSFFSDARFTMLPYAGTDDVVHFAKLYGVDYIVIDKSLIGNWEYFDELIEMHRHTDDVELAYEDKSDNLIRMFRVKS